MDTCRLQARDWLSQSTRKEFEAIISEAKLTPRQIENIELKFIHDLKNYQIAMKIDTSVQTVERHNSCGCLIFYAYIREL